MKNIRLFIDGSFTGCTLKYEIIHHYDGDSKTIIGSDKNLLEFCSLLLEENNDVIKNLSVQKAKTYINGLDHLSIIQHKKQ